MAGEHTVTIAQTATTTVKVVVNAIGSSGSHVPLVIDTTTTRLDGRSEVPTVYYPTGSTGIAEIRFSVVSSSLTEFTTLICKVNGTADSVAFSEYAIPVKVLESEADTQSSIAPNVWGETASTYSIPIYSGSFGARLLESAETYLSNIGLDHLVSTAVTGADVADNSIAARLVSKSATADWDSYNNTTDSLEAIGDAAFDPTTDTVARVTLVDTTTTNSDMRGTDNAFLASSAPTNFTALGINASGHISRVTLNDTTTTNTDMRGTDGANTLAPDNTSITAIKTKTDQLTFTVANQVDANSLTGGTSPADIYTYFTSGTNEDAFKANVSGLATSAEITALNDISAADVWSYATRTITSGGITASEVTDAVWDASVSSHNVGGSFGRGFRQVKEGLVSTDGEVNDASATTTSFISNLSSAVDNFYNDQTIHFISGSLQGQSRVVLDYNGTTKAITVDEALTSAPANGDEFIILSDHVHSIAEIVNGVWSEDNSSYTVSGTFGYNIDAIKDKTDQLTFTTPNKVDSTATVEGGDATAANQTTIIGMLTGATVVVSQSSIKVGAAVDVRQGMDYNQLDGTEISFTGDSTDQWPNLTSATVTFTAVQGDTTISKTCTVTSPTGTQSFRLEFTAAELSSTNAPLGNYRYYIIATLSSGRKTALIEDGTFTVNQPY